jgi:hypothetical protein
MTLADGSYLAAIVATLVSSIALAISAVALRRAPKVIWVAETDDLVRAKVGSGDPYVWNLHIANRGRATATHVAIRFVDRGGVVSPWRDCDPSALSQGDVLYCAFPITGNDLIQVNSPFQPRTAGPYCQLRWRGEVDRRDPNITSFRPRAGDISD